MYLFKFKNMNMIPMYYLLKSGTMAFVFLSIFIVFMVSEGVKMPVVKGGGN